PAQHPAALPAYGRRQLVDQASLADAGLAPDQHLPRGSFARALPQLDEASQLARSAYEGDHGPAGTLHPLARPLGQGERVRLHAHTLIVTQPVGGTQLEVAGLEAVEANPGRQVVAGLHEPR